MMGSTKLSDFQDWIDWRYPIPSNHQQRRNNQQPSNPVAVSSHPTILKQPPVNNSRTQPSKETIPFTRQIVMSLHNLASVVKEPFLKLMMDGKESDPSLQPASTQSLLKKHSTAH
jgi:hypothetical protein